MTHARFKFLLLAIAFILPPPSFSCKRGTLVAVEGTKVPCRRPFQVYSSAEPPSCGRSSTAAKLDATRVVVGLRGGSDVIEGSVQWCANLGAPAALVAGAVIATVYDYVNSGTLVTHKSDNRTVRIGKILTNLLLITSFVMEVLSIFVTTVTSTMLLSRSVETLSTVELVTDKTTPLMFLERNFEFEYLSARIFFLQGLLNWLAAVAIGFVLPSESDSLDTYSKQSAASMDKFVASALITTVIAMLAFYNGHMTFYENYFEMVLRWIVVTWRLFFWKWPPRPLSFILFPSFFVTLYWGLWTLFEEWNHHENNKN